MREQWRVSLGYGVVHHYFERLMSLTLCPSTQLISPCLDFIPTSTYFYRACKDEVGDDHEKGKDDVCLSYLGGWDRSCNSYYDCWNNDLRSECNDCANNGFGCNFKYEQCEDLCLDSEIDCDDECDVCFCESDPDRGIEECQAIGDDCCKDPYGESGYFIARVPWYLSYPCSPF